MSAALQKLPVAALLIGLLAAGLAVLAGLGTRWNLWHFRTGFTLLTWGAYGGIAAVVVALAALVVARSSAKALLLAPAALVLGALVAGYPWQMKQRAQQVPPIHDITTDVHDPPTFVAILPLRKEAPNPAAYGGRPVAEQQQQAYPDLHPLIVDLPPTQAFDKAVAAAREMGWEIVDSNRQEGRLEATDTTLWFGFKDDVVVRVAAADRGSRLDVRSVSRVGKSDVGANARRIREYLSKLTQPAG
jgi:uncharacterized protein (DUF1499 family)